MKWEAEGNAEFTIKKLKKWQKIAGSIRKQANPARALEIYWYIDSRLLPQRLAKTGFRLAKYVRYYWL